MSNVKHLLIYQFYIFFFYWLHYSQDIDKTESKINNLTAALSANSSSTAAKYLISEIENLDKQIISLKYELIEIENSSYKKTNIKKERVVTIEDSAELRLSSVENLVRLETRNKNVEGENEIIQLNLAV